MSKSLNFSEKMVLGTAQFGVDYGIANISGKPTKKEVFDILTLAWEKGVRHFDTAPGYGSEALLGEFITANGLVDKAIVLTKIPSMKMIKDYRNFLRINIDSSLKILDCPIDVLFFHDANDSELLFTDPQFFKDLLRDHPVKTIGISVYEPKDVEKLSDCEFELAFQFPFNVLDRRFEKMNIPNNKRYARSVFLQGLLASPGDLRLDTPVALFNLQQEYHEQLARHGLNPVAAAISFVVQNDVTDYFLLGVDSEKHLQDILELEKYKQKDIDILATLKLKVEKKWLDPREWN